MIAKLFTKIFGTRNERVLKQCLKIVEKINILEPTFQAMQDQELQAQTAKLRQRYQDGASLDELLPEAFALVREASVRTLGMRHFDVQLIGGMILHNGKIAEMRTGEGKTLVATLAAFLNALTGNGVHIVTVNDYLAKRDAAWMGPIYKFLGLTVGVIYPFQEPEEKKAGYAADITYGTNNEFGFDYLRDNMAFSLEEKMQRELYFSIVDEVDSILIDEARTPLIISGPAEDSSEMYVRINKLIPTLIKQEEEDGPGDFAVDEKIKQAFLTENGHLKVEELFVNEGLIQSGESLYDARNVILMHHLTAGLRAHALFHRDVDYIVKNNEVVIVDEHTGRTMEGRRWSDGLHQAIEAKENVKIQNENQTLASITFQNYFRLYDKLAGMTGTADTEAYEFQQIYGLEVVVIPTNMPMVRDDRGDQIYLTRREKFRMILADIKQCCAKGQPVLVGTVSIETSEHVSNLLNKEKMPHQVLNAKQHEKEAKVITQAGLPGAVTIATNMAGRGTDIVLGGNLEAELKDAAPEKIEKIKQDWQKRHDDVISAGGLHIIGSERHESRRIDNQLRGRSGRQGDPGSSRFYLSLEDDLMRIFASERLGNFMKRLGMKEDESIEHKFVTRAIESAQRKVEGHNFDIRKQLLEYDDVANEQRKIIYEQRNELMAAEDVSPTIIAMRDDVINAVVDQYIPPESVDEQWDIPGLEKHLQRDFHIQLAIADWLEQDDELHEDSLREKIKKSIIKSYEDKVAQVDPEVVKQVEKSIMLQTLDTHWKEHLAAMDHLREGIGLRGYAQQDPKQAYKRESFKMFSDMLDQVKHDVFSILCSIQVKEESDAEAVEEQRRAQTAHNMQYQHSEVSTFGEGEESNDPAEKAMPYVREMPKVGRNDSCPCGSGKKYKQCCGHID